MLQTTTFGDFIKEYGPYAQEDRMEDIDVKKLFNKYGDPIDLTVNTVVYTETVIFPLITLFIGLFIGFFSKKKVWLISFLSIFPFIIFFLLAGSFSLKK